MEIKNKVAESSLIQIDLNQFKPNESEIVSLDLSQFLYEGLIIREKEFRQLVKDFDWNKFLNKQVYIFCSSEAIVPTWSYMLLASVLIENNIEFVVGNKDDLLKQLIKKNIEKWHKNNELKKEGKYIIKGCSQIPFPSFAITELMKILQIEASGILFGEPCSTVPVYKKKK
ncbi:MAG: DUF2480 family protein [Flavobacteriia bacterium]|nr:DUF2480 family protein [Flavobacteriia bacterium]